MKLKLARVTPRSCNLRRLLFNQNNIKPMNSEYTASNIRVLTDAEIIERQPFVLIHEIARKYSQPTTFIERGFEVCFRLSIPPDYFINRYILKADIPEMPEFTATYIDLMREQRNQ
ncbi:hypothetical protein [Sansalvadorimonas verongulae]|uniref:hypothetical protein n=1 Tax=Sansalvadorimonas verongulae TaxID=2172824 RepID=UPI0012BC8476|nr:hypothetical protein [Sansalvadorimonas verongulae]MTI13183.1 hypothetical protein [Sansalvadorimonas verongulae]